MTNFFKIIFSFLILTLLIFSSSGKSVLSQDPQDQLPALLQGQNCGALNQQCCSLDKINIPSISFGLPAPFDIITAPINILFNFVSGKAEKLINTITDFIFQNLESNIHSFCSAGTKPSDLNNPSNCRCISEALENLSRLCNPITSSEKDACLSCVTDKKGIWTAIGCVQSDIGTFISQQLLGFGIGLAGIVALLCIIYASIMMQTSSGNPERIKKAQEMLTSCIMGLMLIIFAVFILKLIGIDILRIPGFTK